MKMLKRLPFALQELLKLGFGFYCVVGAISIFCNWTSPDRWSVCIVVSVGLLVVLLLEWLAAGFILLIMKLLRDRTVNVQDQQG
jgi:hypothetical protein